MLGDRVSLNGHQWLRLPNTLNVSILGIDGDRLLAATPLLAASTGSACHAADTEPSAVLLAMGLDAARARAALRLSLGRSSTAEQVSAAADLISAYANGD